MNFRIIAKRYLNFSFFTLHFPFQNFSFKKNSGIALLLVVVLASVILTISVGLFTIVFGEILISGGVTDSFTAFYAADEGAERLFYRDKIQDALCATRTPSCFAESRTLSSGGCYDATVSKSETFDPGTGATIVDTTMIIIGQFRCDPNATRVVRRGIESGWSLFEFPGP